MHSQHINPFTPVQNPVSMYPLDNKDNKDNVQTTTQGKSPREEFPDYSALFDSDPLDYEGISPS